MSNLAIRGGKPVRTAPFPDWLPGREKGLEALDRVLQSRTLGIGSQEIEEFEHKFAAFCQSSHAISCTNGTDALYIALQAMGIGAGDEVIVPSYTFIATAIAVLMVNAIPVFADIDPDSYNINPEDVRRKITPATRAIIPVHIAGNPAHMDNIMQIAQEHNLYVLEDCAQAPGAEWRSHRVGSIGHAGTFSFQSSKNLSAGEGGAIVTGDHELAKKIRSFTNCGRIEGGAWYDHYEVAGNHRLSAFQAAILNVGLEQIEEQMQRREENARYLASLLDAIDGITQTSTYEGTTRHAWHLVILRYHKEHFQQMPLEQFVKVLQQEGIPASTGYVPLYRFHVFQNLEQKFKGFDMLYKGKFDARNIHCPVC